MTPNLSFVIVMITLFSISIKFSSPYNKILGYKWSSAQRVTGNSWKLVIIESMGKFCSVAR